MLKEERIYLRPHALKDAEAVLHGANEPVGQKLTGTHGTFTMAQIVADSTNRRIKSVIQNVATAVFFPI